MHWVRRIFALTLVLLLAGQVVVRPLHRHDHAAAARGDVEVCQFCLHAHPQPAEPSSPGPAPKDEGDNCSVCRFLSCATVPLAVVELPRSHEVAEEALILEVLTAGRDVILCQEARGPPRA